MWSPGALGVVEEYFGVPLSSELVKMVAMSPGLHLRELAERLSPSPHSEHQAEIQPQLSESSSIPEKLICPDAVGLSNQEGLLEALLYLPEVVVADPVLLWARSWDKGWNLTHERCDNPWCRAPGTLNQKLAIILSGLAPLREEIGRGSIHFAPGLDYESTASRYPLFREAIPLRAIYAALPSWIDFQGQDPNDLMVREGVRLCLLRDSEVLGDDCLWELVSSRIFGESASGIGDLRRCLGLESFSATIGRPLVTYSAPAERYFAYHGDIESERAFVRNSLTFRIPSLRMELKEVLALRRGEECFALWRRGMQELLRSTGQKAEGEAPAAYALRLAGASAEALGDTAAQIRRLRVRSALLAKGMPTLFSLVLGAISRASHLSIPGVAAGGRGAANLVFAKEGAELAASEVALDYLAQLSFHSLAP